MISAVTGIELRGFFRGSGKKPPTQDRMRVPLQALDVPFLGAVAGEFMFSHCMHEASWRWVGTEAAP